MESQGQQCRGWIDDAHRLKGGAWAVKQPTQTGVLSRMYPAAQLHSLGCRSHLCVLVPAAHYYAGDIERNINSIKAHSSTAVHQRNLTQLRACLSTATLTLNSARISEESSSVPTAHPDVDLPAPLAYITMPRSMVRSSTNDRGIPPPGASRDNSCGVVGKAAATSDDPAHAKTPSC